jgi:hypothetical protein
MKIELVCSTNAPTTNKYYVKLIMYNQSSAIICLKCKGQIYLYILIKLYLKSQTFSKWGSTSNYPPPSEPDLITYPEPAGIEEAATNNTGGFFWACH